MSTYSSQIFSRGVTYGYWEARPPNPKEGDIHSWGTEEEGELITWKYDGDYWVRIKSLNLIGGPEDLLVRENGEEFERNLTIQDYSGNVWKWNYINESEVSDETGDKWVRVKFANLSTVNKEGVGLPVPEANETFLNQAVVKTSNKVWINDVNEWVLVNHIDVATDADLPVRTSIQNIEGGTTILESPIRIKVNNTDSIKEWDINNLEFTSAANGIYTVEYIAQLPATGIPSQRIAITNETGLFASSDPAVAAWSTVNNRWELETAVVSNYSSIASAEEHATPGTWVGSTGGTIVSKSNARILDTQTKQAWVYQSGVYYPSIITVNTVNASALIKGDSASPAGWTLGLTGVGAGDVGTKVSSGGKLTLTSTKSSTPQAASVYNSLFYEDAGLSISSFSYIKFRLQILDLNYSGGSSSVSARCFFSVGRSTGSGNTLSRIDIGQGVSSAGTRGQGNFFNGSANTDYSELMGQIEDLLTNETLIQIALFGSRIVWRVGSTPWKECKEGKPTFASGTGTPYISMACAAQNGNTSGNSSCICTIRDLQYIRYT